MMSQYKRHDLMNSAKYTKLHKIKNKIKNLNINL